MIRKSQYSICVTVTFDNFPNDQDFKYVIDDDVLPDGTFVPRGSTAGAKPEIFYNGCTTLKPGNFIWLPRVVFNIFIVEKYLLIFATDKVKINFKNL